MSAASKSKWIISIVLGSLLLVLALIGGKWQVSYAADASLNAAPVITNIHPSKVPAGSGNVIMIISGANFGTIEDFIRVLIQDQDHDYLAAPIEVLDMGLSVVITDTLLVDPNLYHITVLKSNGQSVPTNPPNPTWDQVSNTVDFLVYEVRYGFLPILEK